MTGRPRFGAGGRGDWAEEAARELFSEAMIPPSEEMLTMLLDYADDFRRRHALPPDHPVYVSTTPKARALIGETLPAPLRWGPAPRRAA